MLSNRTNWAGAINSLTRERRRLAESGVDLIDLTESNPTKVGIDYPHDALARIMGNALLRPYNPEGRGVRKAREAVARFLGAGDPDDIILTASTSEAYSFLFKLLANPGDDVLAPVPGYPLLEHLASLENIELRHTPLRFEDRWRVDVDEMRSRVSAKTRAVVVVHPNNPTGSYLRRDEQNAVAEICSEHQMAIVSDEVFYEYSHGVVEAPYIGMSGHRPAACHAGRVAERDDALSFSLGGLSKSAGLPHWKLGWIHVGGPTRVRKEALEGLELIADTFLSVSTLAQEALPAVLELAPSIRSMILQRVLRNWRSMEELIASLPALQLLPCQGGWSAVLRAPSLDSEDEMCSQLLGTAHVVVQPGYFYDFEGAGYLVVSLLPPTDRFDEGVRRIVRYFRQRLQ
ncbi:MAG TPA: pyridoxal phosphate-dependent aminotransferase [Thermoanaerobaculia bacterium]|nr:pyridoxal phosphate-dependent aminotransferase [Thermoanaerobaculia bacterium]